MDIDGLESMCRCSGFTLRKVGTTKRIELELHEE